MANKMDLEIWFRGVLVESLSVSAPVKRVKGGYKQGKIVTTINGKILISLDLASCMASLIGQRHKELGIEDYVAVGAKCVPLAFNAKGK